jgi:plastocyanin
LDAARAGNTNVTVGPAGATLTFSPSVVSIHVNDSVTWNWASGLHTSTSAAGLWNTAWLNTGATFSFTFTNAGDYPYFCVPHHSFNMTGEVQVVAGPPVPTVAITNPPNNATFAAPWSGTIQATAAETGGSITNVQFLLDATVLGNVANPPYNMNVSSVLAGSHTLSAVATDNSGVSTNASITVSVVTPVPVVLSGFGFASPTEFQFMYSANPGLRYVVERSSDLATFVPILTNTAAGSSVSFSDTVPVGGQNFYRVARQSNP